MDNKHNKYYLTKYRKSLRNNMTPAEASLWKSLQRKQLKGRKFRRQHSINNYIVDFYCMSEKLAVELDGAYHLIANQQEKDELRDKDLASLGITVLRFENKMVFENLASVLQEISDNFKD